MKYSCILIVLMMGFSIEARLNRLGVEYNTFFKMCNGSGGNDYLNTWNLSPARTFKPTAVKYKLKSWEGFEFSLTGLMTDIMEYNGMLISTSILYKDYLMNIKFYTKWSS